MPSYDLLYKHEEDDDGWQCGVGPYFRDRDEALDHVNKHLAIDKKIGPFTFDETDDVPSDYSLVEMTPSLDGAKEQLYNLYIKK